LTEEQENPTPEEETPAADEAAAEAHAEEPTAPDADAEPTPAADAPETADAATDVAAEEPAAEQPAAEEPAAEAAAPAEEAEPEEKLHPKEIRRRARRTAGEAKPPRTLEERLAERSAERDRLAQHRRARRAREREQRRATAGERTAPAPEPLEESTGRQRVRQGIVVSDKSDKTITVKIEIARPHRVYKKIVRTSTTLHAHDERNEAHIGDTVRVIESRPLSRTKRWRLVEILERAR
jgi:small subunit ribosomal protein S17